MDRELQSAAEKGRIIELTLNEEMIKYLSSNISKGRIWKFR